MHWQALIAVATREASTNKMIGIRVSQQMIAARPGRKMTREDDFVRGWFNTYKI